MATQPAIALPEPTDEMLLPPEAWPRVDHLVTEDDTPLDNIFSEKQQRLLTRALYSSWKDRPFVAFANVGLFFATHCPPKVPDVLLSTDVELPQDVWSKSHRAYFTWEYAKTPDVAIEIVSNREGGEGDKKLQEYADIGVKYYAIFDPEKILSQRTLRLFELHGTAYVDLASHWLPGVGLGLTLWQGQYEDLKSTWLRWCRKDGELLATGGERAEQEHERAEQEHERAEQEHERAEQEHARAERLAKRLKALGVDPGEV